MKEKREYLKKNEVNYLSEKEKAEKYYGYWRETAGTYHDDEKDEAHKDDLLCSSFRKIDVNSLEELIVVRDKMIIEIKELGDLVYELSQQGRKIEKDRVKLKDAISSMNYGNIKFSNLNTLKINEETLSEDEDVITLKRKNTSYLRDVLERQIQFINRTINNLS